MKHLNFRLSALLLAGFLLGANITLGVSAQELTGFTKDEGRAVYTVPENNYIMVKQADWYFLWTPEAVAEREAELLSYLQSEDKSLEHSSFNGSYTSFDTPVSFPDRKNSGVYTVSQNEDGSYTLSVENRQGELDAKKVSHIGYGVYSYPVPERTDAAESVSGETQAPFTEPEGALPELLNGDFLIPVATESEELVAEQPADALSETQLAQVPRTGDDSVLLWTVSVLSAGGLTVISGLRKKYR